MDLVGPAIDIVKLVGGPIVRYLKYQIKFNGYLNKFRESKEGLCSQKHEIESKLQTELQSAPYHVAKVEVEEWLKDVQELIRREDVNEEVNSWGYLSCCSRVVILKKRTQELKKIYDKGDKYTKEHLVIEDHSKKLNYYVMNFKESKEMLQRKLGHIGSTLRLQLVQGKIVKEEVKDWQEKVEEMLKKVKDIEDNIERRLSHSSDSLVMLLGEKIQEMKRICEEGSRLPECLVIEDYSWKLNYYVKNFNELKKKLQCKQGDIGSALRSQLVHGKIEKEEVKYWRQKVEEITGPIAKDIEDKIGGCLPHSSDLLMLVMLIGEKIQEMERICEEGSRLPECLVIDDPLASTVELPTRKLQGNEDVKANILACLKGEEVAKLGVWGMGGVGKTTIMMNVHNELLKEGKEGTFHKIIWVTVSQDFDICNLQQQIASSLSFKEKEKLEQCQSTIKRAAVLSKMIEAHKPYLLILDDVWRSFELNEVGIPELDDGCKLVLTTRSQEVARSMGCRRRIKVETLSREEALKLFLEKVGDTVLSDHGRGIKKDLQSTLKEIVEECHGLPLALVTVAGSLKDTSKPQFWSVALNQLRNCKRNVAGTNDEDEDDAFRVLKFSYDRLKNPKIQYCFLYCALYPEDYNIPKEKIIEYWIDEGFIEEMETRHAMKDEGHYILRKLEDNCLLEFIEDKNEGDCVRMHDLIRDMALHITRASPRFLVEAGKSLRELPEKVKCTEDVEKVSLMCSYIEEIPSSFASSICGKLTTLLLAHNSFSTIPESVFEQMPELKILDLSFNRWLRSLPNSVSKLVNLTTLLLESTPVKKVPSLFGLESLKKLNLRGTKMKEVPEGLGMLTNLKCLALCGSSHRDTLKIDEIADEVLSNLSKLKELFVLWSSIELKGEVVGRLMQLEVFHGRLSTYNMRNFPKCQLSRLSSYFITIGSNFKFNYDRLIDHAIKILPRYKKIMAFKETCIVGENVLFPSVQALYIDACLDVRSLNDFSAIKDGTITDLRRCFILNCDGMECILSSWINNTIVQTLEYLDLCNLHKLDGLFEAEVIAKSPLPLGIFSSLKQVDIRSCKKIKKLFPSWKLVEYLRSLEGIYVNNCEEMEEIIASDPEEEGEEGGDIINLILPKLKSLRLVVLPALKSICSRRAVMVCDSLIEIEICKCKGLRRIPLYLPLLDNAQPSPPPSLKKITAIPKAFWESLEWDHPNAKDVLRPLLRHHHYF